MKTQLFQLSHTCNALSQRDYYSVLYYSSVTFKYQSTYITLMDTSSLLGQLSLASLWGR